jgi:WhiB family redox-sensing transcriptional regulator
MEVDWNRAACKDLPTDFFYKIEDRGVSKLIDVDVFRFTCAPCPIWKQCLGYATHHEDYGVWGGMTSDERKSLLDNRSSDIKTKLFKDFGKYGITKEMILQAIGKE